MSSTQTTQNFLDNLENLGHSRRTPILKSSGSGLHGRSVQREVWARKQTTGGLVRKRTTSTCPLICTLRHGPLTAEIRPPLQHRSYICRLQRFSSRLRESAESLGGKERSCWL